MRSSQLSYKGQMATQSEQQIPGADPFVSRQVYQLVAAIVGNAILAGIFVKALLNPADNGEFIVNTSALIFIMEFLAIHAGGFLMVFGGIATILGRMITGLLFIIFNFRNITRAQDVADGTNRYEKVLKPVTILARIIIFGIPIAFYTFFAFSWGQKIGNLELPIYFGISLASKHFNKEALSGGFLKTREFMTGPIKWTGWFLISFFVLAGLTCQLESWFPFPEEIYFLNEKSWSVSGSGPCIGVPHHWVAWGALYYGGIVVFEAILGIRRLRQEVKKYAVVILSVFVIALIIKGSGPFYLEKRVPTPFQQSQQPAAVSLFGYKLFDYDLFKNQLRQVSDFLFRPFGGFFSQQGVSVPLRDSSDSTFDQIGTEITEGIANITPKFTQILEPGMENNEVRELQIFLSQFQDIYPEGIVNGYYGPLTESAVMRCQQKFGLPVTGKIGPNTIAALNDLWQATQSTDVKNPVSSADVLKTASILDLPLLADLNCLGNKTEFPPDTHYEEERCFKYYSLEQPQEPACPKYFNPVHDEKGIMYPTACLAEKLGVKNYQYGAGEKLKQFVNDLWYTPKENAKSYFVPKPNIEMSYGFGRSGLVADKKGGIYLRSTLWPRNNVFFVLDYNLDTNRDTQFSTNFNPGFTVLPSGGVKKVLLIFTAFEEPYRYPEDILIEWTKIHEKLFNEYLRNKIQLKDPLQLEFTPVVINPPRGIKERDYFNSVDPKTGEKKRADIIMGGGDTFSAIEKEALYSAAVNKAGGSRFDIIVVATDYGGNTGDGRYEGVWNDMEFIVAALAPAEPYSDKDIFRWLKALGSFQTIFRVIQHELVHARGWSADHFPDYQIKELMDLKTGEVAEDGNFCDKIVKSADFLPFKLPQPFQILVGEEPIIWEFGKTYTYSADSSSGRCFRVVDNPGRLPETILTLKDYDRDGIYEGVYGRSIPEEQTAIYEGLQRTMGWADIDGDDIAELDDSDRYGGYREHIGYKPYKSKELIGPFAFKSEGTTTISGCKFEKIRLDNGETGLAPLECLEFNQDIVNIYRGVRYKWLRVKKYYGTVLLARLPSASGVESTVFEKDRPCTGQKIYRSLEEALAKPEDVCVLDLGLKLWPKVKELPSFIGKFTNLKELYLTNNMLYKIPPEIGKLSKLEILDLCINRLEELPREIKNLSNLRILRLCHNGIPRIQDEILNLTRLETLDLSRMNEYDKNTDSLIAKPIAIPSDISRLVNLKKLNLRENRLTQLQSEIGSLRNLEVLNLEHNDLKELPDAVLHLPKLKWLDININEMNVGEQTRIRKLLPKVRISF